MSASHVSMVSIPLLAAILAGCGSASRSTALTPTAADQSESAGATSIVLGARSPGAPAHSATLAMFGEISTKTGSAPLDPAENLRQVSFATEGSDFDPAVSPDGTRVFFASTAHRPMPDIYVKSIDGRTVTQLTNDPGADAMPAINPDGSRIAFASNRAGSWDIYLMNSSGGQAVQLTSDSAHELRPTWSPDGKMLAFCKLGEVSSRWEIWVADADQVGGQRFLTYGLFPDWRPSSGKIAFQRARDRGDRLFSIWTLDYEKGEATNLTEVASSPASALINPRWSRDGEFLAFAAVPNPGDSPLEQTPAAADVWIMNANGTGLANLTGGRFANLMPAWGEGNTVYFVSDRAGRQNIWSSSSEQAMLAAGAPDGPAATAKADSTQSRTGRAPAHAPAASAASAPQPAQADQDSPPELANVPIDDHRR